MDTDTASHGLGLPHDRITVAYQLGLLTQTLALRLLEMAVVEAVGIDAEMLVTPACQNHTRIKG
jgi:hypothetical protein